MTWMIGEVTKGKPGQGKMAQAETASGAKHMIAKITWKRTLALGLLAFLFATVSGCVIEGDYKYKGDETVTEIVDLTGVETIEMKLGSSDVEIVSHEGKDGTFVIKKTFKTNEKDHGPELLKEAEVVFEREGSTLKISRKPIERKGMDMFSKGYVTMDITATFSAGINLEINTGSGDISIDDRTAPVTVRSGSGDVIADQAGAGFEASMGSGDVSVTGVTGYLKFSSGSGDLVVGDLKGNAEISVGSADVEIDKVMGDVKFSSGSGDLEIGSSRGGLVAGTGSGDLEFRDHVGNADITTSSGDVFLRTGASEGAIEIGTSSGEVEVVVFDSDSVELDVRTNSGTMTSSIPIVVKDATRKRLYGKSGDGALRIDITTSSGDISIEQGSI